jgi:hypothetical protein
MLRFMRAQLKLSFQTIPDSVILFREWEKEGCRQQLAHAGCKKYKE